MGSRPALSFANKGNMPKAHSTPRASVARWALGIAGLLSIFTAAACEGCHGGGQVQGKGPQGEAALPTFRLYFVSNLAGALEPCGCVKDQLGGIDHAAALISKEKGQAKEAALVSAGPLFFLSSDGDKAYRDQDKSKAETLALTLKSLNLVAFAPGTNDVASGAETLGKLHKASGASMLDLYAPEPSARHSVKQLGGVSVGFIGVGPKAPADGPSLAERVKAEVAALKSEGAKVTVLLGSVGRGEAKRVADFVPELTAIVVGEPQFSGEVNTEAPPGQLVGKTIIAETSNHLQTLGVLDFYVREGSYEFADASALSEGRRKAELMKHIAEVRGKIANYEQEGRGDKPEMAEKKADLQKSEADLIAMENAPTPGKGSYFRYRLREVRTELGTDKGISEQLLAYYKRVNDENKRLYADRKPAVAPKGSPSYVGIDTCSSCHQEARKVWDKTAHAHAYKTLTDGFKEFNLDCVSCHVTGYDRPGGSTVTFVDKLKDVQCEVCHGPGSQHVENPKKTAIPVPHPTADSCLACHHPPHVHSFDAPNKMANILGPGHGRSK